MKPNLLKKRLYIGLLIPLVFYGLNPAIAQKYDWSRLDGDGAHGWNTTSWGSGSQDMVCDEYGNIYSMGSVLGPQYVQSSGYLDFGDSVYAQSNGGYITPYVVKYNRKGEVQWATTLPATGGYLYTTSLCIDTAGNSYIVGSTWSTSVGSIAGIPVNQYGQGDIWIVKLNDSGNVVWAQTVGGNLQDYPTGITATPAGDIYLTGLFQGYFQYGNTGISGSSAGWSVFLLKLNTTGSPYYCRRIATTDGTSAWQSAGGDVVCDRFGNVYVSGAFTNTLQAGASRIHAGSSQQDQNGFVMKVLPSNGTPLWARQMGATTSAIAVDESGMIYAAGRMMAGADSFYNTRLTTNGGIGADDLYVSKLTPTGALSWVKRFGDNSTTTPGGWWWTWNRISIASLDVDFAGKIFVSGTIDRTTDSTSICEFYVPPFNGNWSGSVYATDAFLLKITTNGTSEWNARSGIRDNDSLVYYWEEKTNGGGVSTDNAGATYWKTSRTWGYNSYGDTVKLFFNNDTNEVALEGGLSYYTPAIWAIREQYIQVDSFAPHIICPGDSIRVYYSKHDNFDVGNTFTVKLSNRAGVFFDAISIGSVQDTGSGVIDCAVPLTVPEGSGYRLRVDATGPAIRGYPFEDPLRVKPTPPTNAGPDDSMCYGDTVYISGSGGANFAWFSDPYLEDSSQVNTSIYPPATQGFILRSEDTISQCYYLDTTEIRVISHPKLDPRTDTTICQGESVWLYTSGYGGKPKQYLYSWFNTKTSTHMGYGDSFQVSPRETTPYRLVLYDSCSIIRDTAIVTVNVRGHIQSNARPDTTLCIGEPVTIYAATQGGLDSQYNYRWYVDTNLVSTDSSFVWPSQDTSITFKLIVDDGGCSDDLDSSYFTAIRRDSLKLHTRTDTLICDGQGIWLHAWGTGGHPGGYTYTWDHGLAPNDSNFVVPTQSATNYKVQISDGCTNFIDTNSITITLRYPLTVLVRPDSTICRGESLLLHVDGTGGDSLHYTYDWQGIGVGNNISVTPNDHTTYYVTLTDNCTALSTSDSVRITLRDPLKITAMADTTICRENTPLLHATGSGGYAPGYEFVWSDGTTETTLPAGIAYAVSPKTDFTYTVRLQDNCTVKKDSSTVKVILRDWLEVSTVPSDTTICHGAVANLQASGKGGLGSNYTYSWQYIGNGASQQVQPLVDSSFRVIMSDGCSPWDTAYVQVRIATPLSVTGAGDTLVCPQKPLALRASGSGGVSSTYTFTWSHALGTGTVKKVVPAQDEKYVVTLTDNCSFPAYDTVYVTMAALPDTAILPDIVEGCQPLRVELSSGHQDTGGFSNWKWYLDNGKVQNTGVNHLSYLFEKPGLFPVKVEVTSNYGCVDSSRYADILVHPKPVAIYAFSPKVTDIVTPVVTLLNSSTQGQNWYWDFGDGNSSTLQSPIHTYADTGYYDVTLFVESQFGCKDTLTKIFRVNEIYSCYIPSGFTPNQDLLNDEFHVNGTGIERLRIWIYDRWGALIFYSEDENFHWDGTSQESGEAMPTGVYLYRVVVDLENGNRENKSGTISLVR